MGRHATAGMHPYPDRVQRHDGQGQRPRPPVATRRALVLLAAGAVLAAACGSGEVPTGASAQSDQRPEAEPGISSVAPSVAPDEAFPADWQAPPLRWAPCAEVPAGECATLPVPLDWDRPDGATIELALARIPAIR